MGDLAIRYQSHQSGIETRIIFSTGSTGSATNRTNLELKPASGAKLPFPANTTNRTNLELKQDIKMPTDLPGMTTNRTNLELKLQQLLKY